MNQVARIATTMSSREIAHVVGKEHKNVIRDIRVMLVGLYGDEHIEKFAPERNRNRHAEYVRENADAILTAICEDGSNLSHPDRGFKWERDSRGYITAFHLNKELSLTLVSGYNVKLRKQIIDRWTELEANAAGPAPSPQLPSTKLIGELAVLECFTRLLRPSPSSQVAMLAHISKNHGLDLSYLPNYVEDTAPDMAGAGSMPTKPISALLSAHGIVYTAKTYNALLRDAGFIEMRSRKSSAPDAVNGMKQFWVITEKGMRFGKNLTNPKSPRATQPHWYESRFTDLNALVMAHLKARDA